MKQESRKPCNTSEKPATGNPENAGAVYGLAESLEEQHAVIEFWRRQFEEKSIYLKGKPEAVTNEHSFVYHARIGNQVVAACRLTRKSDHGWEVGNDLPGDIALEVDRQFAANDFLQLNRVSVDSAYRTLNIHLNLFFYCARWLRVNADQTGYFAICKPALVRFYKGLGAALANPESFPIKGRGERRYYLISGQVTDAIAKLSPAYSPPFRHEGPSGPVAVAFRDRAHGRRTRLSGEDAGPSETPQTRA